MCGKRDGFPKLRFRADVAENGPLMEKHLSLDKGGELPSINLTVRGGRDFYTGNKFD